MSIKAGDHLTLRRNLDGHIVEFRYRINWVVGSELGLSSLSNPTEGILLDLANLPHESDVIEVTEILQDTIKKDVSSLSDEELMKQLAELRSRRGQIVPKAPRQTKVEKKEQSFEELAKSLGMTDEQIKMALESARSISK